MFRALKIDRNSAILIGVGSSICGGSAVAAAAPVIGADDEEIAQAIYDKLNSLGYLKSQTSAESADSNAVESASEAQ